MNKLPVGQTIQYAYAFTFGQIGTVIGLIWIPTLINAVASFFVLGGYYQALADSFESGVPPAGAQVLYPLLLAVLTMILLAMIGVAITQQALGLRKGPAFAHFSLGTTELRVFGGFFGLYMLLVLFVFIFAIAAAGAGLAVSAASSAAPAPAMILGVALAALAGLCALIYLATRLSFLLVPSVLDGREFGLSRSWELTKGNFWRIFAVSLATLLPIILIMGIAESAIMGPAFFVPDAAAQKNAAASLHQMAGQMRALQAHMPLLMGLSFVVSPLMYGLLFAPAAFAYRVLSGKAMLSSNGVG
ncbi:MAG TPA: hypothetical protein VII56_07250 [Rhizomicrobium sp.]